MTPLASRPDVGPPLRVTLIDDDELTARGIVAMLREHPEQIEIVRLTRPQVEPIDVALYDNTAVGRVGAGPTLAQLLADPRIRKVALYTWNYQPWAAADLMRQGASAYLTKSLTSAELVEALRAVHAGRGLVSHKALSARKRQAYQAERGEVLSEREAEMLSLITRGLSNAEIATTLNLSVNTVKSYIRTCYRKIDVDSRSKAVLWGLGHGFGHRRGSVTTAGPTASSGASEHEGREQEEEA